MSNQDHSPYYGTFVLFSNCNSLVKSRSLFTPDLLPFLHQTTVPLFSHTVHSPCTLHFRIFGQTKTPTFRPDNTFLVPIFLVTLRLLINIGPLLYEVGEFSLGACKRSNKQNYSSPMTSVDSPCRTDYTTRTIQELEPIYNLSEILMITEP